MKSLSQFIKTPDELKATYLMDYGKFVIRKSENKCAFDLYVVHDYFVEVLYDYSQANIIGFMASDDFESIEKYLDNIDLEILV